MAGELTNEQHELAQRIIRLGEYWTIPPLPMPKFRSYEDMARWECGADCIRHSIGSEQFQISALTARMLRIGDQASVTVRRCDGLAVAAVYSDWERVLPKDEFENFVRECREAYEKTNDADIDASNLQLKALRWLDDHSYETQYGQRPGWVYVVAGAPDRFKIGKTENLDTRIKQLSTASAFPLKLLFRFEAGDFCWFEQALHRRYEAKRVHGEWFSLNAADIIELKIIRDTFIDRECRS